MPVLPPPRDSATVPFIPDNLAEAVHHAVVALLAGDFAGLQLPTGT